jgi:hypothetical protein
MVTLWNRFYIFSGKIKLPIVEQIIRDAIEYDSYSTGEEIIKILETDFLRWYPVNSIGSLCNNRVYLEGLFGGFIWVPP